MRKKIIITLALTAVILGGVAAWAIAGSSSDPLISLEYLEGTYKAAVLDEVQKQTDTAFSGSYNTAAESLEEAAQMYKEQLSGILGEWTYSKSHSLKTLIEEDCVTMQTGSGFFYLGGEVSASISNGELINVTEGTAETTAILKENHRYLVGEGATVVLTAATDGSQVSLVGCYKLSKLVELSFTDVSEENWFFEYVYYIYRKGLMTGMTQTTFEPDASVTRGMLATILYRQAGAEELEDSDIVFDDVKEADWYHPGIIWGAYSGIVKGMGEGIFAPMDNVTREQLATMLFRYADEYAKVDAIETGDTSKFTDHADISDWAADAMSWAVGAGILTGSDTGALSPGGSASRAEAAAMLQRFVKYLENK